MKKRFHKFIKNERGFGNPIESLIPIAIIGIIAAIAIPAFNDAREKRPTAKDANCITTMIAIAQKPESTEDACPVSELEYKPIVEDTQVSVSCPDPEAHLLSDPQIMATDQGLLLNQTLPELNYAKSGIREIADRTVLANLEEAVVVTEKMGWRGYLIAGLIILALVSAVIRSTMALVVGKNPGRGLGIVSTWAFVCLVGGFFFQGSFVKPEYRFSKVDGTLSINDRYAGETFSEPEIINDIVGVVPLRKGEERMSVAIFYETTKGIRHKKLFRMDKERLEIIALLNHALFEGDPAIFEPPEPPAEQTEAVEKTITTREEKPGFFETLKALIAGKENKPRQRFPTFIPKSKPRKRQFSERQWTNPDDDVYRKSQVQQENLIKAQMETLRRQQIQQEQMARQAEALRRQQLQQEQMWQQQLQYDQLRNQHYYHQGR